MCVCVAREIELCVNGHAAYLTCLLIPPLLFSFSFLYSPCCSQFGKRGYNVDAKICLKIATFVTFHHVKTLNIFMEATRSSITLFILVQQREKKMRSAHQPYEQSPLTFLTPFWEVYHCGLASVPGLGLRISRLYHFQLYFLFFFSERRAGTRHLLSFFL